MESVDMKVKKTKPGRPVVKKKFDVTSSFYAKRDAVAPAFEVSVRGDVEIDLFKLACAVGVAAVACAVSTIAASISK